MCIGLWRITCKAIANFPKTSPDFRPAPSTEAEKAIKWAGRGIDGIIVGYHVQSDGTPDGSALVCSVEHVIEFLTGKVPKLKPFRTVDFRAEGFKFPIQ